MSDCSPQFTVHVLNPDKRLLANAEALQHLAIDVRLPSVPATNLPIPADADVILVSVDTASDLDLVSLARRQAAGRPVIATAGQGFAGRSLEYVLLQAELRGASATLVRPFDAHDLAACVLESHTRGRASDLRKAS